MIHYLYYNSEEERDFLLERKSRCPMLQRIDTVKDIDTIEEGKAYLFTDIDIFLSAREKFNNLVTIHIIVDGKRSMKFINVLRWFKDRDIKYINDDPTTGDHGTVHRINEDNIKFKEEMPQCRKLSRDCRRLTSRREYLKLKMV